MKIAVVFAITCGTLFSQTTANLEFEVASVRLAVPQPNGRVLTGVRGGPGTSDPGQIIYDFPLKALLSSAYGVKRYQVNGPAWLDTEIYEVIAKIPPDTTGEQAKVMLQNLLADRFNLKLHRETREFPLYEITVAKGGPKLKLSGSPLPSNNKDKDGYSLIPNFTGLAMLPSNGKIRIGANAQPLSTLALVLTDRLGGPVVDKTGLTATYNFTLEFASPNAAPDAPGDAPELATAMQEQLGLRLEKTKGPLEMIVVDKGDKVPTEN